MDDYERFTEGDCHVLARRISRVTGWPCATFVKASASGKLEHSEHVWNVMPDGRYLDVNGAQEPAEFLKEWICGLDILTFSAAEIARKWGGPDFGHYSYERARIVADRLLTTLDRADRMQT